MLSEALTRYVELHCSLGFKFRIQRVLLANFVRFAEGARRRVRSSVARVLEWAVRGAVAASAPEPAAHRAPLRPGIASRGPTS